MQTSVKTLKEYLVEFGRNFTPIITNDVTYIHHHKDKAEAKIVDFTGRIGTRRSQGGFVNQEKQSIVNICELI